MNDAVVSFAQDQLLDRRRVADTLLDIRLVLTDNGSRSEPPDRGAAV